MSDNGFTDNRSIVIIDDDQEVADILSQYADAAGTSAVCFNGLDDIELNTLTHADVIFLDLMLETHDGLDIIKVMQEHDVKTPVIICSGMDAGIISSAQDLLKDYGLNFAGKLIKPFTFDQFAALIGKEQAAEQSKNSRAAMASHQLTRADVQLGISSGWVKVAYQPKLDPVSGQICGVECLARFEHPLYGMCMPGQFLSKAAAAGLMTKLTESVIQTGLEELCNSRIPTNVTIAFNIDPGSLSLDFLAWIISTAADYGVQPNRICLEVTELSALELSKDIKTILTKLRIRGFSISLDDFGTGYSTIQELNELPFNELKVDRLFVMSMLEKDTSLAIVRSTIELAKQLQYTVVAEGVETQEQLDRLIELGCHQVQGFLFCRPVDIAAFEAYFEKLQFK